MSTNNTPSTQSTQASATAASKTASVGLSGTGGRTIVRPLNIELLVRDGAAAPTTKQWVHETGQVPAKHVVKAKESVAIRIEGKDIKGDETVDGLKLKLKKVGADLLVETENGETLVYLDNFYNSDGAVLVGSEWGGYAGESLATATWGEGAGALAGVSPSTFGIAPLAWVGGGLGVAALSGGSTAVASKFYTVTLALGPVNDSGAGTTVTLYKEDGKVLGEAKFNATTNRWEYTDPTNYSGKVFAVAVDKDGTVTDYRDEATNANADMADMLAAGTLVRADETQIDLFISPLSSLAAQKALGVTDPAQLKAKIAEGTLSTEILAANVAAAKLFGIGEVDIARQEPVMAVTGSGQTQTPNAYGAALVVISTLENNTGLTTDQFLTQLAQATTLVVSDELLKFNPSDIGVQLIEAAQNPQVAGEVVASDTAVRAPLESTILDAYTQAALTDIAPQTIGALTVEALVSLTPQQVSYLTPEQVQALSPTQLNALVSSVAISGGADDVGDDTWAAGLVNDATPTLSGTFTGILPPTAVVAIYDGSTFLGNAVVSGNTWTLLSPTLADGAHTLTARVEVPGGASGASTAATAISVDTLPPAATLANTTEDAVINLAASTATEGVVTVSTEAGAAWTVTFTGPNGSITKTGTGTGAAQPVTLTAADVAALGQGAVTTSVTSIDAAGNATTTSTGGDFLLDTVAPAASLANTLAGAVVNLAESTAAAGVTAVTVSVGEPWTITFTGPNGTVTKTGTGTGVAQPVTLTAADVAALGQGAVTTSVTSIDAAGNATTTSTGGDFTLETVAPAPVLTLRSGESSTITSTSTVAHLELTDPGLREGDVVTVHNSSGVLVASYTVTAADVLAGKVVFEADAAALGQGTRNLTATVTDAAGNTPATTSVLSLVVDTVGPTLHATTAPVLSMSGGGDSTGDKVSVALTFSEPVYGLTSGTTTGVFMVPIGGTLTAVEATWSGVDGSNTRTLTYTVLSSHVGNLSIDEAALTAALVAGLKDANNLPYSGTVPNIDAVALPFVNAITAVATITSVTDDQLFTQGLVAQGTSTDDRQLALAGTITDNGSPVTALPSGQVLRVYSGTTSVGDATLDGSGGWTLTTGILPFGVNQLKVQVENTTAGLTGAASALYPVNVTGIGWTRLSDDVGVAVSTVTPNTTTYATATPAQATIDDNTPTLSGTLLAPLAAGEHVAIYNADVFVAYAQVGQAGNTWFATLPAQNDGIYAYNARVVVGDGTNLPTAVRMGTAAAGVGNVNVNIVTPLPITKKAAVTFARDDIGAYLFNSTTVAAQQLPANRTTDDTVLFVHFQVTDANGTPTSLAAGEVLSFYSGTTLLRSIPSGASGNNVVLADGTGNAGFTLPIGQHDLRVQVENPTLGTAALNISGPTTAWQGVASTAWTTNVANITLTGLSDNAAGTTGTGYIGNVAAGATTDDNTPTLYGNLTAPLLANETIRIFDDKGTTATADDVELTTALNPVSVDGLNWSFTPSALTDGTYSLVARVYAADGTTPILATVPSTTSLGQAVTILTPVPVTATAPVVSVFDNVAPKSAGVTLTNDGTSTSSITLPSTSVSTDLTIQMWLADDLATDAAGRVYLELAGPTGLAADRIQIRGGNGGEQRLIAKVGAGADVNSATGILTPTGMQLFTFVISYTSGTTSTVSIYQNDTLVGTGTSGAVTNVARTGIISPLNTGISAVGDVAIWDRALSAAEVAASVSGIAAIGNTTDLKLHIPIESQGILTNVAPGGTGSATLGATAGAVAPISGAPSFQGSTTVDQSTDDNRITISGTIVSGPLPAGQFVQVYDDGVRLGTAVLNADRTAWTFNTTTLAAGHHVFTAFVENSAGERGAAAADLLVNVAGIAVTAVVDDFATPLGLKGTVAAGGSTDDLTPTVTGTLTAPLLPGEIIKIYNGNTYVDDVPAVNVVGTTWTYEPGAEMGPGTYAFNARVFRADGTFLFGSHASGAGYQITLVPRVTPSAVPTIVSMTDDVGLWLGDTAAAVQSTDDSRPVLSGTLSEIPGTGEVVAVYLNGVRLGEVAPSGQSWTFPITSTLAAGVHAFTARVENTTTGLVAPTYSASKALYVTGVTMASVVDDFGASKGEVAVAGSTDDARPTLSGTLTAPLQSGERLALFNGDTQITDTAAFSVSGTSWTYTPNTELAPGAYNFNVRVVNSSDVALLGTHAAGAGYTVTILPVPQPVAATAAITTVADNVGLLQSNVLSGQTSDDTLLALSGTYTSGTFVTGQVVAVYNNGVRLGNAQTDGAGNWTYLTSALNVGTRNLQVQVENPSAGSPLLNTTGTATTVIGVASPVHKVYGNSVTLTGISDDFGTQVGSLNAGAVTDDRTPTLQGALQTSLQAGEVVGIYNGDTRIGQATVNGTAWFYTIDPAQPLNAGTYLFNARIENASGVAAAGTHAAAAGQAITVAVPSAITTTTTITTVALDGTGLKTSNVAANQTTDDALLRVEGNINQALDTSAGQVVGIYRDGVRLGTADVNGNTWTFLLNTSSGVNNLQAQVENPNVASPTLNTGSSTTAAGAASGVYQINYALITGFTVTDNFGDVTGTVAAGGITDDQTPTFTISLTAALLPGEKVVMYSGNAPITGTATKVNDTTWTFTPTSMAYGSYTDINARVIAADNTTVLLGTHAATLGQTLVISQPAVITTTATISTVTDNASINGTVGTTAAPHTINTTASTDDTTPTVNGTLSTFLKAGEVVAIYSGSTRLGVASVNGSVWSFTPTSALAAGTHVFSAQVENPSAGATTAPNAGANTTAVGPNSTTDITLNISAVAIDSTVTVITDTTPTITGTLTAPLLAGEVIKVFNGETEVASITPASGATTWSVDTTALTAGLTHTLTARVFNAAGQLVLNSTPVAFSVALTSEPLAKASFSNYADDTTTNGSVSSTFSTSTSTDDAAPQLFGAINAPLAAGEVVRVYDSAGALLGQATMSGSTWNYQLPNLPVGLHTFKVQVENLATGLFSTPVITPVIPVSSISLVSITDDVPNITGNLGVTNVVTDDQRPAFGGALGAELQAGESIKIYDGSTELTGGTLTRDGLNWSYVPGADLSNGLHTVQVRVVNAAGQILLASAPVTFTVNNLELSGTATITALEDDISIFGSEGSTASPVSLMAGTFSTDDTTPTLKGLLTAPLMAGEVVRIYDGATLLGTANVSGMGWTYTPAVLSMGSHSFTARVENLATGAQSVASNAAVAHVNSLSITAVESNEGPTTGVSVASNIQLPMLPLSRDDYVVVGYGDVNKIINASQITGYIMGLWTPTNTNSAFPASSTGVAVKRVSDTEVHVAMQSNSSGHGIRVAFVQQGPLLAMKLIDAYNGGAVPSDPASLTMDYWGIPALGSIALMPRAAGVGLNTLIIEGAGETPFADSTPVVKGTLAAPLQTGELIGIYKEGQFLGNAVVDTSSNTWSYTLTSPLPQGSYGFTAVVKGADGSTKLSSAEKYYTLTDALAPTQTVSIVSVTNDTLNTGTINTPASVLVEDGGLPTDDRLPTIRGTISSPLSNGHAVEIFNNGQSLGYASVSGTAWSFQPNTLINAGQNQLVAKLVNLGTKAYGDNVSDPFVLNVNWVNGMPTVWDDFGAYTGPMGTTNDKSVTLKGQIAVPLPADGSAEVAVYATAKIGTTTVVVKAGVATTVGTEWTLEGFDPSLYVVNGFDSIKIGIQATGSSDHTAVVAGHRDFPFATYTNQEFFGPYLNVVTDQKLDLTVVSGAAQPVLNEINVNNNGSVKLHLDDVLIAGTDLYNASTGYAGLDSAGKHQIRVLNTDVGNATLPTLEVMGTGWTAAGTTVRELRDDQGNVTWTETFAVYNNGNAQLLIENDITRLGAVL